MKRVNVQRYPVQKMQELQARSKDKADIDARTEQ